MRVKCFTQEHNTMFPARAQTQTSRSGDECTNHEATANKRNISKCFVGFIVQRNKTFLLFHVRQMDAAREADIFNICYIWKTKQYVVKRKEEHC